MAVNSRELKICKRRGHDARGISLGDWIQCQFCGMWLREVRTIEERADEPPKADQNQLLRFAAARAKA
jgi:hypothetical protein